MVRNGRSKASVLLLLMSLLAASCTAAGALSTESTTLTLGHAWASTDANAKAVQRFADEVERESGGSLKIEIYTSGQLGEDAEALEGLDLGTVDMWVGGSGVYSQMTPLGQFLVLPYLFVDIDEAMSVYNSRLGNEIQQLIAEDTDTRVISFWPRGARHLTLNKAAVTPADIAGMRIRVPENPMISRSWQAFGASPTPMAFGDVLTALEQGALEGQENPLATIDSAGLSVAQSTLVRTGHVIEPTAVSIGEPAWNRLSTEQRTVLERVANGPVREDLLNFVRSEEARLTGKLAGDGMRIVEPNRATFRARTADLARTAGPVVEQLYHKVVEK